MELHQLINLTIFKSAPTQKILTKQTTIMKIKIKIKLKGMKMEMN